MKFFLFQSPQVKFLPTSLIHICFDFNQVHGFCILDMLLYSLCIIVTHEKIVFPIWILYFYIIELHFFKQWLVTKLFLLLIVLLLGIIIACRVSTICGVLLLKTLSTSANTQKHKR